MSDVLSASSLCCLAVCGYDNASRLIIYEIFTSFYEDLQVSMRNRYLALTNQITSFVTTMI